jgi:heme utilization protein HutZ
MDHTQKDERLRERLLPEIDAFKHSRQTLQLATRDSDGIPNASYSPFALTEAGFYILVSDIARHGKNLKDSSQVSVMLLEDESEAKTVFARRRLTFDVTAEAIARDSAEFEAGVNALAQRFGDMPRGLAQLADFNLYRLTPKQGLYVKGFGQAFALSGSELLDIQWQKDGHRGDSSKLESSVSTTAPA